MRMFTASPILLSALLVSTSGAVQAADMLAPAPGMIYSETVVSSGHDDWSGFYAGFNLGYGWGEETPVEITAFPDGDGATFGTLMPEGWLGGAQAGFNRQFGNLVVGVEGDLQLSDFHAETSGSVGGVTADTLSDVDWYGSLRPRIGFATGPALIYATGGLAFGGLTGTIDAIGPAGETGTLTTSEDIAWGYSLGGGVEYMLNERMSVRSEYQFTHLSADATGDVYDSGGFDTGVDASSTLNADIHTVKVGLNFHF